MATWFFHTSHIHAQMLGLNNYGNTLWLQGFDNGIGDLGGETLLKLRAFG